MCVALSGCEGLGEDEAFLDELDDDDIELVDPIAGEGIFASPSAGPQIPAGNGNGNNGNGNGNGGGGGGGGGGNNGNGDGNGGPVGLFDTVDNDGGNDVAYAAAVDGAGNVLVAGRVSVNNSRADAWLRKYDIDGNVIWTRTFNAGEGNDYGFAVAVDSANAVIVGGRQSGTGEGGNFWVRKLDANGGTLWESVWNSTHNGNERVYGLAVDPSDNILATGQTWALSEGYDFMTRKYGPGGNVIWTDIMRGADHGHDSGRAVASDSAGNVIVAGKIAGSVTGDDLYLRKYSPGGAVLWSFRYNENDENDELFGVTVDAGDNIVAVGAVSNGGLDDNWMSKLGPAGNVLWTINADGGYDTDDHLRAVTVDATGTIVTTGRTAVPGQAHNLVVRKYKSDGAAQWTRMVDGADHLDDIGYGVVVTPDASAVAVGVTLSATTSSDIFVRKWRL